MICADAGFVYGKSQSPFGFDVLSDNLTSCTAVIQEDVSQSPFGFDVLSDTH